MPRQEASASCSSSLRSCGGGVVIGTVSSDAKAHAALAVGADHAISYDDFAGQTRDLTGGQGVAVVYDGVGATTFEGSLAALRVRGPLVVSGPASGPPPPLEIPRLNSAQSTAPTFRTKSRPGPGGPM